MRAGALAVWQSRNVPAGVRSVEEAELAATLLASPLVRETLLRLDGCGLPNWLLGAGAVAQTFWNARHRFDDGYGIADLDIAYYEPDSDADAEDDARRVVLARVGRLGAQGDVKNQARVHEWYPQVFGDCIRRYTSIQDAVASWPTTATAVGVRMEQGNFIVVSAFGVADLVSLIVRPNRVQVPRAVFEAKAARWKGLWPRLAVMDWSDGIGIDGARVSASAP